MKHVKSLLSALVLTAVMTTAAFADQIGVVDLVEVSQKYSKQQSLANQAKSKEEELMKLRNSLTEQLKAGEKLSPVEKKNLEDKLNSQFAGKVKEYREWLTSQQDVIQKDFVQAVQEVASSQKLDIVLPKQSVLKGGKDITADVLSSLNK